VCDFGLSRLAVESHTMTACKFDNLKKKTLFVCNLISTKVVHHVGLLQKCCEMKDTQQKPMFLV